MTVSTILPSRLPADPLLRLISIEADTHLDNGVDTPSGKRLPAQIIARRLGVSKRTVCCWMAGGLSVTQADRLTAAQGWHPIHVWGAEAWERVNDAYEQQARQHAEPHPDRCGRCGVPHVRKVDE